MYEPPATARISPKDDVWLVTVGPPVQKRDDRDEWKRYQQDPSEGAEHKSETSGKITTFILVPVDHVCDPSP
jgi:hypothetical protein